MQTLGSHCRTLNRGTILARTRCAPVLLVTTLLYFPATAATPTSWPPQTSSRTSIPWAEVGAAAGTQYSGDGLSVTLTREGARLRCVFQRMEGEATPEGLWLSSTVTNEAKDRFRVTAVAVGRGAGSMAKPLAGALLIDPVAADVSPLHLDSAEKSEPTHVGCYGSRKRIAGQGNLWRLPETGAVLIEGKTVRFSRAGLVEEYTVSMDGVRQDFVVLEKPGSSGRRSAQAECTQLNPSGDLSRLTSAATKDGELRVELALTGAKVEPIAGGAQLVLENSGRKIAYSRLKVTDANGKELPARMEAIGKSEIRNPKSEIGLAILVDDADAVYPVRIDPTFSDTNWISMGGIPGANSRVSAAVADASGNLYIGGEFTMVGDLVAHRVAKWNGSSWSVQGSGMSGRVRALAVSGNDLYAGGSFTTAGGVAATNIAKWNGNSWSAVGSGIAGDVRALAVSGSDLYVGGWFTNAGGVAATNIGKWNGSSWSAVGSGITAPADSAYFGGAVWTLAVSGSEVYAGGRFTTAGGVSATNIAKWNGSSWSALGSGIAVPAGNLDFSVFALAVADSDLYVGGRFTTAGEVSATNIAKWNGNSWSALGSGLGIGGVHSVHALAVSGSDLYAGGYFWRPDGSPAYVAKWNGSSWSALGSGMLEPVFALALSGSDLYAGGDFTTAGGVGALRIAKWDGSSWSALSSGINGGVTALAVSGSDLYVGGGFTTAGEIGLNYIAKWNGSGWDALSSGLNGAVYALAVSGSDLYAGGVFTTAGGMPATNIAKWDGSNWTALGSGIEGDPAAVYTLAVSGSDLYAGGVFTMAGGVAATNVAKWDGSNWTALGSGIGPDYAAVYALAVSGNDLLAGGYFWTAGGRAADLIAKWDGSSWSAVGSGLGADRTGPFYVSALAVSGGDLYAGGQFRNQGGVSAANVAKWNGSNWSALGSGIDGGRYGPNWIELPAVNVLTVSGSDLYAGGGFTMAGGVAATNIAKWDGTNWSALGSGMNHGVSALAVSGNELYAGGSFTTAGGKVSAYLAKAIIYPPVLTLQHSASGTNLIRFSGVPGTAYHLQRAPTLAGPWPSIATNTAPANGRIEVGDGAPLGGQGFYRVFEP